MHALFDLCSSDIHLIAGRHVFIVDGQRDHIHAIDGALSGSGRGVWPRFAQEIRFQGLEEWRAHYELIMASDRSVAGDVWQPEYWRFLLLTAPVSELALFAFSTLPGRAARGGRSGAHQD